MYKKKVKSMQMFHKPVTQASQGDRVGICVTQLDAKQLERGLAADPGFVLTMNGAIISVEKIRFFKGTCESKKSKFHITIGHSTVMAIPWFFKLPENIKPADNNEKEKKISILI